MQSLAAPSACTRTGKPVFELRSKKVRFHVRISSTLLCLHSHLVSAHFASSKLGASHDSASKDNEHTKSLHMYEATSESTHPVKT